MSISDGYTFRTRKAFLADKYALWNAFEEKQNENTTDKVKCISIKKPQVSLRGPE